MKPAHAELLARVEEEPQLAGMGTTITALLRSGNRLALAHIGDSRAYLLRDGVLTQITKDHTFVQTLVDEGRLTPEEAEHHPQRSVLMRVLSDIVDERRARLLDAREPRRRPLPALLRRPLGSRQLRDPACRPSPRAIPRG